MFTQAISFNSGVATASPPIPVNYIDELHALPDFHDIVRKDEPKSKCFVVQRS